MRFTIVRVVGNELPPRDQIGSKLKSLQFILETEPSTYADKFWVVNHIHNRQYANEVKSLLKAYNQDFFEIDFLLERYQLMKTFEEKIRYSININAARNYGVKHCQQTHQFTICLDQDCFFTEHLLLSAISNIESDQLVRPDRKYFGLVMKRLLNAEISDLDNIPNQEPHLIFRNDANEYFDESIVFGQNDKIELLHRIGYNMYSFEISGEHVINVGYVLHTSYGNTLIERDLSTRVNTRKQSLETLVSNLDSTFTNRVE